MLFENLCCDTYIPQIKGNCRDVHAIYLYLLARDRSNVYTHTGIHLDDSVA